MTLGTSTARHTQLIAALTLLIPLALNAQTGFTPPPPHVNAPPAEIKRMPGEGNGAYKTGKYRDLFAEQGHPAIETKARLEKAFQHSMLYMFSMLHCSGNFRIWPPSDLSH